VSVDWNAVVNAAVTAAIVTLAIEYFAKPRLEIRKERLLNMVRDRHELTLAIVNLSSAAAVILLELPPGADAESHERLQAERQRQYSRMRDLAQRLFDDADRYAAAHFDPIRSVVIDYVVCTHGVMLSGQTPAQKARIVRELAVPMAAVIAYRLRRLPAGVRALFEVRRLIADLNAASSVQRGDGRAGTSEADHCT
jgi:hypothetical protein